MFSFIAAEKAGFRRFIQDGVNLEVNQNARVDAVLSIGQLTESISVTADATGVDTRSLQQYLGHKNIQHTVRYTELSPERFKDFWRD